MKRALLNSTAMALLVIHMQANVAAAATQAGVSAAVRGEIDLAPVSGQATHQTTSGEDIFLGDGITSHDDAGMQLMLLDETVFTIGANTDMTIDEFVYDPATGAGEVVASVAEGVFRFVTGNIAQGDPEDMTINLPVGTIGIRGTIGAASMLSGVAMIVLLGPGPDNNAGERPGHLEVTAQGVTINLTRPRWGTIIEPGQPPTPPVMFSDIQIETILGALSEPPAQQEPADVPSGGVATVAANQDMAESYSFIVDELPLVLPPSPPVDESIIDPLSPFGSITTLAELFGLSGTFEYFDGVQYQLGSGDLANHHYKVGLVIDFSNRTIGGGASGVEIQDSDFFGFGTFNLPC